MERRWSCVLAPSTTSDAAPLFLGRAIGWYGRDVNRWAVQGLPPASVAEGYSRNCCTLRACVLPCGASGAALAHRPSHLCTDLHVFEALPLHSDDPSVPATSNFRDLSLSDAVIRALEDVGYESPSPI